MIPLLSATLTIVGSVVAYRLTDVLSKSQSWAVVGAWMGAGIVVTYLLSQLQARSQKESPEALTKSIKKLRGKLREEVQKRSFGTRRNLIEAPLHELDLDMTPRMELVRDPKAAKYEPPKKITDIAAAFKSSKRRLLIVGGPGSGKTIAAYSLIEYLDKNEVRQIEGETGGVTGGVPLLVNLSAWEGQDNFEAFLVDYLCSSVGYQEPQRSVAEAFIASRQYSLILDGLDEMAPALRKYFAERLDEFVEGLPSEVAVVVTCRTREYEKLLDTRSAGLGLVQAVEILPLTDE
jgi:predicted NACHT family NTPase